MEKKDIYVVQLAWSYDVNSGIDLALFDSREKAIAKFKEIIEQEKQHSYAFLAQEKIEAYLNRIICGDINNLEIRKLIVKIFIKEIIVYKDKITLVFNFTDQSPVPFNDKNASNTISAIEDSLNQLTTNNELFYNGLCLDKTAGSPPVGTDKRSTQLRASFLYVK